MKTSITIKAGDAMRGMTLTVNITGARVLAARIWLGKVLILLAARVMGCGVHIKADT